MPTSPRAWIQGQNERGAKGDARARRTADRFVATARRLGCARLLRVDREVERGQQSGPIVLQHQLTFVEMGDGLGEREAEAGAFVRTARIEAAEAAARLGQAVGGDAWAAVADLDPDVLL